MCVCVCVCCTAWAGRYYRTIIGICWVWDDRMISHQPKNQTLHDCSLDLQLPWVGANQCTYPLLLQLRATAVRIPEYCSYM
eukprot:COSAG05_NODE_2908_length_2519_cov_1.604545_1_plen_81_part_00